MHAEESHEAGRAELRRHMALDDRGGLLRATWRPARGYFNMSLWRDDRCVETFHLTPPAAAELVAFLARGLASEVPAPAPPPPLRVVATSDEPRSPTRRRIRGRIDAGRRTVADTLEAAGRTLRG